MNTNKWALAASIAASLLLTACATTTQTPVAKTPVAAADPTSLADDPSQALTQLFSIWGRGNATLALTLADNWSHINPANPRITLFRALCLESERKRPQAAALLATIRRTDAPETDAAATLLETLRQPLHDQQITHLQELASRAPDNLLLLWAAGVASYNQGDAAHGVPLLLQLADKTGGGPATLHGMIANLDDLARQYTDSLQQYQLAAKIDPQPWNIAAAARTLAILNRRPEAEALFARALQINPNYRPALADWGILLHQWGDDAAAVEKCRAALALNPVDGRTLAALLDSQVRLMTATEKLTPATRPAAARTPLPARFMNLSDSAILGLSPADAYAATLEIWGHGNARRAETLLPALLHKYPADQQLALFNAINIRSRFYIAEGDRAFARVFALNPDSLQGRCAQAMLLVDNRPDPKSLEPLDSLATLSHDDPTILWAAAIACRTLDKNNEGIGYYERLLARVPLGSALVHQTFANLLDGAGRYDEALVQRKITLQLEPAGWAYQGLGNTLQSLKRYPESCAAFAKATEYQPDQPQYWADWAFSLSLGGHPADALVKARHALRLAPRDPLAAEAVMYALDALGRTAEAIAFCDKFKETAPPSQRLYQLESDYYNKLGKPQMAKAIRAEWKARILQSANSPTASER